MQTIITQIKDMNIPKVDFLLCCISSSRLPYTNKTYAKNKLIINAIIKLSHDNNFSVFNREPIPKSNAINKNIK